VYIQYVHIFFFLNILVNNFTAYSWQSEPEKSKCTDSLSKLDKTFLLLMLL